MKKITIIGLLVSMLLTGCGTATTNESTGSTPTVESNEKVTGIFQGWADQHSIEVKVEDEYDSYYVKEEIAAQLDGVEELQEITFEYHTNQDGRLEITSIGEK